MEHHFSSSNVFLDPMVRAHDYLAGSNSWDAWPRPAVSGHRSLATTSTQPARLEAFARLHGLTSAETEVVQALAEGACPKRIACRRDVSICTVRAQLHSIYEKTGQRTQTGVIVACFLSGESASGLTSAERLRR